MNFRRKIIPTPGGAVYVNPEEVCFLKANRHYTRMIMNNDDEHQAMLSLSQVHDRLDCRYLIRTHRSYVVNVNHIYKVKGAFERLKLTTKHEVPVSRKKRPEVKKILNGAE